MRNFQDLPTLVKISLLKNLYAYVDEEVYMGTVLIEDLAELATEKDLFPTEEKAEQFAESITKDSNSLEEDYYEFRKYTYPPATSEQDDPNSFVYKINCLVEYWTREIVQSLCCYEELYNLGDEIYDEDENEILQELRERINTLALSLLD